MLIAEQLLLVCTKRRTGRSLVTTAALECGLAGGVLIELTMLGRVSLSSPAEPSKPSLVQVADDAPTGSSVLDDALRRLQDKGACKPDTAVRVLRHGLRKSVSTELETRGLVHRIDRRVCGVFPSTEWALVDVEVRRTIVEHLYAVLTEAAPADTDAEGLIALLCRMTCLGAVVAPDADRGTRRTLEAKGKRLAHKAWPSDAVHRVRITGIATVAAGGALIGAAGASIGAIVGG